MTESHAVELDRVRGAERIASIDVIRGIAILFILFMNIPGMGSYAITTHDFRYPTWTTSDWWAQWGTMTLLEGTQRGLLELLFGAGIMIMARKAMTPDGPVAVADLHFRRNLWLCALGLFNAWILMWWGDILLVYGIAACFLFPFRLLKPRSQMAWAALFLAAMVLTASINFRDANAEYAKNEQLVRDAAAHKTLSKEDQERLKAYKERLGRIHSLPRDNASAMERVAKADKAHRTTFAAYWQAQFDAWKMVMGWFWIIEAEIVATMLIGMAFYQWGIIQGKARSTTYLALMLAGYGLGGAVRGSFWFEILSHFGPQPRWQDVLPDVSRLAMTLGHLGALHLAMRTVFGRWILRPFEAAGKMPLTIYLFTSLLMMWIVFAPWALGMFGRWGIAQMMEVAALIILIECAAANWWMRRFHNGPMEWLWKSLAYQRREPFRRAPQTQPDAIPAST